jgi:hypothetical protein
MNVAYLPVTAIATYPFILGDVSGDSTTLPFHSPSAGLMSEMVMYANYKNRVRPKLNILTQLSKSIFQLV